MDKRTIYFLLDTSGSMKDCKTHTRASSINEVMKALFATLNDDLDSAGNAKVETDVAVLCFSSFEKVWYVPKTPLNRLGAQSWQEIGQSKFTGTTPTGEAIKMLVDDMKEATKEATLNEWKVLPAVIFLISDGEPNDGNPTYEETLEYGEPNDGNPTYEETLEYGEGGKATNPNYCAEFRNANRIAIAIQPDDSGRRSLQKFGRIRKSLQESVQPYYEQSDEDLAKGLLTLIKHVTISATQQ